MKKIFIFAAAVATMGLVSCDIDNVENLTEMSTSEFPKTDSDIEAEPRSYFSLIAASPNPEETPSLKAFRKFI